MDRLRTGLASRFDDAFDVEIAVTRARRTDVHRFVGKACVPRIGVGIRKHSYRAHPQATSGPDDPARDFASIAYQNLGEHGLKPRANSAAAFRGMRRCLPWPPASLEGWRCTALFPRSRPH